MAGNPSHNQKPRLKTFGCSNCGAAVTIRTADLAFSVVCESCGTIFDTSDPHYRILATQSAKTKKLPLIPLGTRGRFKGRVWEVIGYMVRRDVASHFFWDEYLLFNPRYGYRWLVESDGHWNFVTSIKGKPKQTTTFALVGGRRSVRYQDTSYDLFHMGSAEVHYVVGEFYWRVKAGDKVDVADYIAPPYMLSRERTREEETWSLGEYLSREELIAAFKKSHLRLPPRTGVAPNEPSSYATYMPQITSLWFIFGALLLTMQLVRGILAANELVYFRDFTIDSNAQIVSQPFELKHGRTNLKINLESPVDNNWLYVAGELVNEQTGDNYPFDKSIEYYHGVDGGESWTEGSRSQSLLFPSIPEGRYHLLLEPSGGESWMSLSVKVIRDVVLWSNFLWMILFVSIPPIWYWTRKRSIEMERWSISDYSPYHSDDEE